MAILAELQAYRAALEAARYNGVREVRDSNGEAVVYRSDAEMARALAFLDSEIHAATTGTRPAVVRFTTSKGL
jgi:hypothetical protein